MVYIEHDGALFRGFAEGFPQEVWSRKTGAWTHYPLIGFKPVEWGSVISETEAQRIMNSDVIPARLPSDQRPAALAQMAARELG
ncbi:hypothetical protein [Phenylobacterium sp.]|uniref:hypothetical protein n=1 Tax=Phenylobacterium sp. TaxID=1871053 RepID=UPI002FC95830